MFKRRRGFDLEQDLFTIHIMYKVINCTQRQLGSKVPVKINGSKEISSNAKVTQ